MTLSPPLRIVADENMPLVEPWFSGLAASITRLPGRSIANNDLTDADVLLVRSVTRVNRELLAGTAVRFVGSATIGTDHIDQTWLKRSGIDFHHAPGCNAQSVVDWVLSVFSRFHLDLDHPWWQQTIGIVGAGHVGGALVDRLQRLGARVLICDPPRAEREGSQGFVDLNTLLLASDLVCLHTPLTRDGAHPTLHLLNASSLALMKPGAWLINAGRGPVIEEAALLKALQQDHIRAVLDVWPNEPEVNRSVLEAVYLASPHVAGYSQEGRWTGTRMLAEALHRSVGLSLPAPPELPPGPTLDCRYFNQDTPEQLGSELIQALYDPARDTVALHQAMKGPGVSGSDFDALRKAYPKRRELAAALLKEVPESARSWLQRLGFSVPADPDSPAPV